MLRTFSGAKIKPLGIAEVKLEYEGQKKHLNLSILEKSYLHCLVGRVREVKS